MLILPSYFFDCWLRHTVDALALGADEGRVNCDKPRGADNGL